VKEACCGLCYFLSTFYSIYLSIFLSLFVRFWFIVDSLAGESLPEDHQPSFLVRMFTPQPEPVEKPMPKLLLESQPQEPAPMMGFLKRYVTFSFLSFSLFLFS
jgi:hypothetical protein